jgi:hypothetical protein
VQYSIHAKNNNLEVVFIMRKFASTLCMVLLLQSFPAIAQTQVQPAAPTLPKVQPATPTPPEVQPAAPTLPKVEPAAPTPLDPVEQVLAAGLMANYSDGQFHPEQFISRAELASILVKAFGLDTRAANQENLIEVKDVPKTYKAFNDIQTVLKTGIMKGYRDNMFFPNQKVTRAEAFAIFAQAYGVFQFPANTVAEILAPYPDAASIPDWAKKSWATALNANFVNTDAQNNIFPLKPMTRGDMAYALSKYLEQQQTR